LSNKKRILVVDDEQINLEFFDVMLSKLGFAVHKAENGQEALEAVRRLRPDLIILDNIMPKLSGWEVTKIIKSSPEYAEFSEIPIIMFSALDDVKDKVEGLELGADDYITKPFNFAEVLARIRAILRSYELVKQIENREQSIIVGERAVAEMQKAIASTKRSLEQIGSASDLVTAKELAAKTRAALVELDSRFGSFSSEYAELRNKASDIKTLRGKPHRAES